MDRRSFLSLAATVAVVPLALAACGDDADTGSSPDSVGDTAVGTDPTTGPVDPTGIPHPVGAEEVVIRAGTEGGFVPMGFAFVNFPTSLVTGDGRVISPGVLPAVYPGPLVKPLFQRTITDEGLQALLSIADDNGLLAEPPEYARNDMLADAPDTVVVLNAGGGSFTHRAYALGFDAETDPARKKLAAFYAAMGDLSASVGDDQLGPEEPFVATQYRMLAMAVDPANWEGSEPAPVVEDWPADAPVRLADAGVCAMVDASFVESTLADATELTFFVDADVTYQLFVAQLLPGDAVC